MNEIKCKINVLIKSYARHGGVDVASKSKHNTLTAIDNVQPSSIPIHIYS